MRKFWRESLLVVLVSGLLVAPPVPSGVLADQNSDGLDDVGAAGLESGVGHVYEIRTGSGSLIAGRTSLPENFTSVFHGAAQLETGPNVQPFVFGYDAGGSLGWVLRSFDNNGDQRFITTAFPSDIEDAQIMPIDVDGDDLDEFAVLGRVPGGSWILRVFSETHVRIAQDAVFPGDLTNIQMASYQAIGGGGVELLIYGKIPGNHWFAKTFSVSSSTPTMEAFFILYPEWVGDVTVSPLELNGTTTTTELAVLGRDDSTDGKWLVKRLNSLASSVLGFSIAFPAGFTRVFLRPGEQNGDTTTDEFMAFGQNAEGAWGRRFSNTGSRLNQFLAFSDASGLQASLVDLDGDSVTDGSVVVVESAGKTLFKRFTQEGTQFGDTTIGFPSSVTDPQLHVANTHTVAGTEIVLGGRDTSLGPIFRPFDANGNLLTTSQILNPNVF